MGEHRAMSIDLPESAVEVDSRAKTDVQRELTGSNPFLKDSWLGAIVTAFSNRIFDFYLQLNILLRELFWNTSTGEFLEIQASWFGKTRLPATQSNGNIIITGTATTSVPLGTEWKTSDDLSFLTTAAVTIAANSISVSSITRSGQTATVTTISDHNLSSEVLVDIAGAVETEYNGTGIAIQVTGANTFTYTVVGTPSTPATGAITADFISASAPVQSVDFGEDVNLVADAPLTIASPIVGVDNDANVDFGEIGGGTNQETDSALRTRFLDRVQNPVAHFNIAEIEDKAKEINGVTRVFVEEITPDVGQVTVYFMRDNDDNPIPSGAEVTTVKDKILEIKPANTSDADVIVAAPAAVVNNFVFTALAPSTSTMKTAIDANLAQFFDESTEVGVDIEEDAYRSVIFNTVDTETGDTVQSFALSAPVGDVTIASGEIGTLGTVTYP
jgi:uncharacterized phage protein gp47/JayE